MAKITEKTKKRLAVGGLATGCIVLAVVLTAFFPGGKGNSNRTAATGSSNSNVSVSNIIDNSKTDVYVPTIDKTSSDNKDTASSDPVLDVEKKEHVETNITEPAKSSSMPEKPTVSDKSALTNSSQKPSYRKKQTEVKSGTSTPKNGQKKSGYIYVDGFGWIKDEGGGAAGEVIDDNGDINKQVGNMN